jgi:hypothetical protein
MVSSLLTDVVVAASITAVPATIAAWAALRVNRKVSTNGTKKDIGLLVEENVLQVRNLSTDLSLLADQVRVHHADTKLHCQKCEEHIMNSRGFCDNCGNLM